MLIWDRLSSMPFHVIAIGGTTYATRVTTVEDRSYATFKNSQRPVLVDFGGESDIIAGLTAAQVLAAMESYHDNARTRGAVYTLCATVPPATVPTWYTTNQNDVIRPALNTLIRASTHWDKVIDIDALANSANPSNATYYYDGIHPTATLAGEWADLTETKLGELGIA